MSGWDLFMLTVMCVLFLGGLYTILLLTGQT